jgi:O-antigen ligase
VPIASARVGAACLLMVASVVTWRRGELFAGSLDPVVAGKALGGVLALVLAFVAAHDARPGRHRLGTGTLWLLAALLVSSVLGALAHGTLVASGIVAVRVAVLAATVFYLLRAAPGVEVLAGIVRACALVAAVSALTGVASLSDGRLFGGIPPLHANDLALLAGIVVLWVAWRVVLGEAGWVMPMVGATFLGIVWVTGSRTGLIALVLGVAVMALFLRRARVGLVVGSLVGTAAAVVAVVLTGAVAEFLQRGGTGTSTLESRFIAWTAARSWAESAWQWAFGGGLSVKLIPVDGQWWNEQLLDSSWVSALVQAGIVGLVVAGAWAAWVLIGALRAPRPHRILFVGLLAFLLSRSVLESGLFDATPAFLVFVAVSLLAEGASRTRLRREVAEPGILPPDRTFPGPAAGASPELRQRLDERPPGAESGAHVP